MKDWVKKSLFFSALVATVNVMIATSFIHLNISHGEAVPLIPIHTGNVTLDKDLPVFYDCIDKKIDDSKGVEEDNYLKKEPTKNEVTTCYNEVFTFNSDKQSSTDTSDTQSSTDTSDTQSSESVGDNDIERFNMLFGNIE